MLYLLLIIFIILVIYFINYYLPIHNSKSFNNSFYNKQFCYPSSNFMGPIYSKFCPKRNTGHPTIFGPPIWTSLHIIAENYPKNPNKDHIKGCQSFLQGLPYMLPCGHCGYHLKKYEKGENFNKNCNSRINLRKFIVNAHNNVNKHEGKPLWTTKEAEEVYAETPACLVNERENKGWYDKTL